MTSFLSASLALFFALLWVVIACLWSHVESVKFGRRCYERGYREGFSAARELAEVGVHDWWADAEEEVERTRKEMKGK
jgi:hypothetical protein